ncbi:hypothetical protein BDQ12DRAFT_679787 [Crucibulum laeve]|uniref:DNA repair protein REV1 n=1 Tax=Crucibulum laeve TaxID=68775 RepID=A0A5C3M5D5_9AGAR|nr:hypothetical protein BDQ12DRAFT_679787 [Crucibulum laeve]
MTQPSQSNSSDYFDDHDSQFLEALQTIVLPGDLPNSNEGERIEVDEETVEPPPCAQPSLKRRLLDEDKDENNGPSEKRMKLSTQESNGTSDRKSTTPEPPPCTQAFIKRHRHIDGEEAFRERNLSLSQQIPNEDDTYAPTRFGEFGDYMRKKRAKLQIQNAQLAVLGGDDEGSQIFRGIAIYINGHTKPSVQDLRQLIVQHGGIFQPYLVKKALVTHIVTCSLTPAKVREFRYMKVVRPEWLVDSVAARELLPWRDYIFIHNERPEASQGVKTGQRTLFNAQTGPPRAHTASQSVRPMKTPSMLATHPPQTPIKSRANLVSTSTAGPSNIDRGNGKVDSNTPEPSSVPAAHPQIPAEPRSKSRSTSAVPPDPLYTTDPDSLEDASRVPAYAAYTSNPLAERVMANPGWRKAHTSIAPGYVEGFYKHSRLHHLSTWKSELRNLVQEAQEKAESGLGLQVGLDGNGGSLGKVRSEANATDADADVSMRRAELVVRSPSSRWKGKQKALDNQERVIMHCDFDCFFVSAGLVSRPHLKGKPVVVCHSQGRQGGGSSTSEIASASYEARSFGVRNGMSLHQARKLCPNIITIPYEFESYKQFSLQFYTVLMSHADDLQAVSVDEALIDVTSTVTQLRGRAFSGGSPVDPAKDFAESIRAQIRKATNCEVSIGIAHNIMLARLATRQAKPAGSFHLKPELVAEFMADLDIADLHGFGSSTKQKAQEKLGVTKLGELVKKSKDTLCEALGKGVGETLYNALRGVDNRKLESDKPRKSVSCDINYGIRFEKNEQVEAFVYQMASEIKKRLESIDMLGRSLTLKIMKRDPTAPVEAPKFMGHGACDLFNKQMPLLASGGRATRDDQIIGDHAWRLLKSFNFDPKELRGIGIQVTKLESTSEATNIPVGQKTLSFKKTNPSTSGPFFPESHVQVPNEKHILLETLEKQERHAEPSKASNMLELPPLSQVDKSVFEALPRDLREELEQAYKRRSASPFPVAVPLAVPAPMLTYKRPGPSTIFPQRFSSKETNVKRIARQLAPRKNHSRISTLKSLLSPKAKRKKPSVKISEAKLQEFGMDSEVFFMLPMKIQYEQLAMARIIKEKGFIPEVPSERRVLKPRKPAPVPEHLRWVAPAPKARYPEPPFLRRQGKKKTEKLYFTETDDIQSMLEKWMHAYHRWAPREKDVELLTTYLLKCVDNSIGGDSGVERAIAVMKWWLVLLRRYFPGSELEEEGEPDGIWTDRVGNAWWDSFRGTKKQMDIMARQRYGGKLSYK